MSIVHALPRRTSEENASREGVINIEDFIRLYYGEVEVEDVIQLYGGQLDLNRVAMCRAPTTRGIQTRSSSFDAAPIWASHERNWAMTRGDDDDSGFFSRDLSTTSSPRRRSLDSAMHEQLSLLTLDFRLNLPRMSERLAKPLPALPVPDLNRQAANLQAEDTGSSSYSPKAANRQRQPYFSHINGQEFRGNSGALAELPIAKEGTIVADKPTLPLCPTTSPERSLILPTASSGLDQYESGPQDKSDPSPNDCNATTVCAADRSHVEARREAAPALVGQWSTAGLFQKTKATFFATYAPRVDAPLVLPSAPTDKEKYGYLHTNRLPLYAVGVFSFLSLTAGMWLFVISSQYFACFGIFCGLLQTYLFISYAVGLIGKDFDFDNHKKVVAENPIVPGTCPTIDIYLPCCKEPLEILQNTYDHVRRLEYPMDKLKVYVLDDGAMESVKHLAMSYGFEYICRDDRPRLKKAGNLRWAFARTHGDFFNIYDADFCPRSDFLLELLPMMLADEKVAIVQSPQFFRTLAAQTWVEQGAGAVQELFYRVVQVNRDHWGASICVGSNAIYRRAALEEVGGTAEIGFSEDVHTGFGCVHRGWKVKYNPLCLACGVCPDTPRAFFSQQMRWCMGSTTLLSNPDFWKSNLTLGQKICYLCGMMYYSAISLSIFVNPLPGIFLLWIRPDYFKYYNLAFAVPSLLYTLVTFRLWSRASFSINVQFVMVVQSYAYFTAIKDRIFRRALAWAPSGDPKAHKNNKYRNMRILAWCWLLTWQGALIAGITYRIIGGMAWWNTVPLLVLDTFNFFLAHRFLFCQS